MSYLFASSHLPENRVRRPEDEEDESLQPELRSGTVRAFSHLPAKKEAEDPAGPLARRIGRQLLRTGIEALNTPPEDGVAAAKASGIFDAVRQQYNRGDAPHFMDEEGNLRPRNDSRPPDSPSLRDPRSPQSGAGAGSPPRPAWDAGHRADDDDNDSSHSHGESFRTSPPASESEDTRPWYMPAITHEDLNSQHFDDDAGADDSAAAPESRPEVHDLVYRTPGASKPKPVPSDLLYRFNDNPEEAEEQAGGFFQNVAGKSEAPAPKPTSNTSANPNPATNPPAPPKPSTTRLLTEGEKQLVRAIFGDTIKDLDKVEIRNRNFIPIFQRSDTTMTPNGNLYLAKNLRGVKDFSKEEPYLQAHLIHEMTHVWQKQDGMSVKTRGLISWMAPYDYQYETGKDFRRYRLEQQATMIADYFLALRGVRVRPQSKDDKKDFFSALLPSMRP